MVKCVFCGKDYPSFTGTHLIKNIGTVEYYCSSKCRKNSIKLKRDKRKKKWTVAFHETRDKARAKIAAKAEQTQEVKAKK